jgi:hypothetical protein
MNIIRQSTFALLAASALVTLGGCNLRTEDELLEERVQRAEAAAKKAVAAQQAAEEALEKIRLEENDRQPADTPREGDELDGSAPMADSRQADIQNGPTPEG